MKKYFETVIITGFLTVHFILGYQAIKVISPTYDESVHLAAGYSYLKANDYRCNSQDHPPLAKMVAAFPLLFLNPSLPVQHPYWQDIRRYQYPFANIFVYHNKVDAEKMIDSARLAMISFSLFLGLAVFLWSRRVFGVKSAIFALVLWCFFPPFLANTTLITTDMALTLFFFTTMYLFMRLYKNAESNRKDVKLTVLFGLSLGFCFASKYSAVGVLPVIFIIWAQLAHKNKPAGKKLFAQLMAGAVFAFFALLVVYRFNSLSDFYFFGLNKVINGINSGRASFLLGQYSTTGWFYYFPVTFMLKTPLPLLAMLVSALVLKKTWTKDNVVFLLIPAVVFFTLSCFSKVQIGHRHILPVYPFLMVIVSGMASYPLAKVWKYLLGLGLVLFVVVSLKVHPWYISYVNAIVGPQDNGYKFLADSNVDWGQGLKALGKYLKREKAGGIYLSYFGTANPSYYGIKYFPIGFVDGISPPYTENERTGDNIDFDVQEKVFFAVSATNLQATYYADKEVFSFLKGVKPRKVVAHSIMVYDLKGDPETYRKFKNFLGMK